MMNKNILHITGMKNIEKYGGLERWFVDMALYAKSNADVFYIVYQNDNIYFDYYNKLKDSDVIVITSNNKNYLIENIKKYKITNVFLHFQYNDYYPIIKYCNQNNISISLFVHCGLWYTYCNDWKKNIRLIIGTYYYKIKEHFLLKKFDYIYCVSEAINKEYQSFFKLSSSNMKTIYIGKDVMIGKSKMEKKKNKIIIGCIAFFGEIKGLDILIQSLVVLKEKGYDFMLLHIGGKQIDNEIYETYIKELVKQFGLEDYIEWLGVRNDIIVLLSVCDIYCQPSRHEALSLSILEAITVGLPIVASNVGGIKELVYNNINGFLFEKENYEQLADYLEYLIIHKNKRDEFSKKSIEISNSKKFNRQLNFQKIWLDL